MHLRPAGRGGLNSCDRPLPRPSAGSPGRWSIIPYDKSALVGQLHEMGQVLQVDYEPEGARVRALMDARGAERFARQLNG